MSAAICSLVSFVPTGLSGKLFKFRATRIRVDTILDLAAWLRLHLDTTSTGLMAEVSLSHMTNNSYAG
jgi:hypothetical protein